MTEPDYISFGNRKVITGPAAPAVIIMFLALIFLAGFALGALT